MKDPDILIGGGMVVGGGSGLTLQFATQVASLTVIALNAVIALGGLYLLWLRIKRARKDAGDA